MPPIDLPFREGKPLPCSSIASGLANDPVSVTGSWCGKTPPLPLPPPSRVPFDSALPCVVPCVRAVIASLHGSELVVPDSPPAPIARLNPRAVVGPYSVGAP